MMLLRNGLAAPNHVLNHRRWPLQVLQIVECHMTFPMNDLVTNKSGKCQFEMEMGALVQEIEIQKQFEKCEMWDSFNWLRQLRGVTYWPRGHLVKSSRRGGQSQCGMGLSENGGTIQKKQRTKNTKREKKIGEMWDRQLRLIDVVEWWILSWRGQCRFKLLPLKSSVNDNVSLRGYWKWGTRRSKHHQPPC